jgi:hypothetical protein
MRQKRILEYSAGIGNIFKIFRIDFAWRANYLNVPETNRFTIKGSFGFNLGALAMFQSFPLKEKRKRIYTANEVHGTPLKIDISNLAKKSKICKMPSISF